MIYFHLALKAEAQPLIVHYDLKPYKELPFSVYKSANYTLVVSLPGYDNALMATSSLLAHFNANKEDFFINLGLCGAPQEFAIGTLLEITRLHYETLYPYTLAKHSKLPHTTLRTLDVACSETKGSAVDMEAYAVYKAASLYIKHENIAVLKVVSDHFEPETLTKNLAQTLIAHQLKNIETFIKDHPCQQPS